VDTRCGKPLRRCELLTTERPGEQLTDGLIEGATPMTTDYDAPRGGAVEVAEESLEDLKTRRHDVRSAVVDVDADDAADTFELPDVEVLDEEVGDSVSVVPMRANEFRCARCFLVHHRSQLAVQRGADLICRECA
jgi:uncharacterized protein DUF4193